MQMRSLILSIFILALLLYCTAVTLGKDVKILNMMYSKSPEDQRKAEAMEAGFQVSLKSHDSYLLNGINIRVISVDKSKWAAEASETILSELKTNSDMLLLLGPMTGPQLASARPVLKAHNLVAFAPFMIESAAVVWDPYVYFIHADPIAEVHSLIHYALAELRVHRIGFMFLTGTPFGNSEHLHTIKILKDLKRPLAGEFVLQWHPDDSCANGYNTPSQGGTAFEECKKKLAEAETQFEEEFKEFSSTSPQAVIVCGTPSSITAKFVTRMLTDPQTIDSYLLGPSMLRDTFIDGAKRAKKDFPGFALRGRALLSGTTPMAKDTRFDAIKQFRRDAEAFLSSSDGMSAFPDGKKILEDDRDGALMVYGWIAGEILAQTLSSKEWIKDRPAFQKSLFDQRRYAVHDLLFGDYGGICTPMAQSQGAMCECNQGGHTVFMARLADDLRAEVVPEGQRSFSLQMCDSSGYVLSSIVNGVSVTMSDNETLGYTAQAMLSGGSAATKLLSQDKRSFTYKAVYTTEPEAVKSLKSTIERNLTTFVLGPVVPSMLDALDPSNITFIDPIFPEPRLNVFQRNVLHFAPILEQELYVLAQFLGQESSKAARVEAVVRGQQASDVAAVIKGSLSTVGMNLDRVSVPQSGDELSRLLPRNGNVFVIGIKPEDVPVIAQHLKASTSVRVLVPFTDMAMQYPLFVQHFSGRESAQRVVFATGFPHWADVQTTSFSVKLFHSAVSPDQRTPLSLWGFLATRAVNRLLGDTRAVSPEELANEAFKQRMLTVDDMMYGPYMDKSSCAAVGGGAECWANYGATTVSVWALGRAINPSEQPLLAVVPPSVVHVYRDGGIVISTEAVIGIVIGIILVLIILFLGIFFLLQYLRARGNRNAPKDMEHPVTLIFTDIQSSTALWAACPEIMPEAVATHHRLIRRLIAKYKCYEVKTIGDSFMIACKSASAAVQLVFDLQRTFLQHDWGTSAIDDAYHEFEERQAEEDADYEPPTARLDAAVYRKYWSGLRVRAGVHTGLSDIRHDEVTKRYDYYGSTSNTAARTESVAHGGQVLLTGAAYMALSAAERAGIDVTALGPVELRGVPQPVEVYQLNAVPGRAFAKLRLDKENECEDGNWDYTMSLESRNTTNGSDAVTCVSSVLKALFRPLMPYSRVKLLAGTCGWWGIDLPVRGNNWSDDMYECCLINRLAQMVSAEPNIVLQRTSLNSPFICKDSVSK